MSGVIDVLNGAAALWWPYAFHAAWQAALVGVIMLAAVRALRRRSAPLRYGLLLVALAKFAIPPMLALPVGVFFWMPEPARIQAPALEDTEAVPAGSESGPANVARAQSPELAVPQRAGIGTAVQGAADTHVGESGRQAPPVRSARLTLRAWLMALHIAGAIMMGGWMLWSLAMLRKTLASCRPAWEGPVRDAAARASEALGLRGDVEVFLAPGDAAPMAVGLFRPAAVLPESMAEKLDPAGLEVVLAHELAHLRRRDPWVLVLENVLLTLWWFNPVVWMLVKSLRRTREDCCDDLVLSLRLADEHTYCRSLINAASTVARPGWSPAILGFADRMHPLGRRLTRLMDTTLRKPHRLSLAGIAVLAMLAIAALPGLRTASAGPAGAVTPSATGTAALSGAEETASAGAFPEIPGKVIFHGKYRHRSRGGELPEPGELWLKQTETGAVTAITRLPFMNSTEIAKGNEARQIIAYASVREAQGDKPGYRLDLNIQDGQVLVTRRGIREDWDDRALPVPKGALFDPNSRPDPYAAANIVLRGLNLAGGERKEMPVYDWDNSGDAMAAYTISFTNVGKEQVIVPAGKFEATHIVLEQVTSGDTWFKKRATHVTDFWVLDNGVIVRILRHREPYELELLEWSAPETLPGYEALAAGESLTAGGEARPYHGRAALRFDGAGDFIMVGPSESLDIRGDATISAWIRKQGDTARFDEQILWRGDETFGQDPLSLFIHNDRVTIRTDAPVAFSASSTVPVGHDWNFWTGVRDAGAGKLRVYLNGGLVGESPLPQMPVYDTSRMWIVLGAVDKGNWQYFHGDIGEIQLWNIVRSPEEIRQDMEGGIKPGTAGLVAYWNFEEGSGQELHDASGNGHDVYLGKTASPDPGDPAWITPAEGFAAAPALPPAPSLEDVPGEVAFKALYKHFSRGQEAGTAEVAYKKTPDGGLAVWSELTFYPSTYLAVSDAEKRLQKYVIHYPSGERPGYHAEYVFGQGAMQRTKVQEGQLGGDMVADVPAGASFDPNTRPDPYCVAPILLAGLNLSEGQSKELDVYDTDYTGEDVESYRIRFEHKGKERIELSTGKSFEANHVVLTQLSTARTWFKKGEGHVTDFWVLDNGVLVRIYRHREPYEVVLLTWSVPDELPGLIK